MDHGMIRKNKKKKLSLETCITFFEAEEILLDGFDSRIFSIKSKSAGFLNLDRS